MLRMKECRRGGIAIVNNLITKLPFELFLPASLTKSTIGVILEGTGGARMTATYCKKLL